MPNIRLGFINSIIRNLTIATFGSPHSGVVCILHHCSSLKKDANFATKLHTKYDYDLANM